MHSEAKLAVKDEYIFGFVDLGDEYDERELEKALIGNIEDFVRPIKYYSLFYDEIAIKHRDDSLLKPQFQYDPTIVFIANEDNVFPREWDTRLAKYEHSILNNSTVMTVNQIEPAQSIYGFPMYNCGVTAETFDYAAFTQKEAELSKPELTMDGEIFPFLISKKDYMRVGGFDLWYKSPFWVDVDFWLKLELSGCRFFRTHSCHLYHFGGRSTKMGPEGQKYRASESVAGQQFQYKWGFMPNIVENVFRNNTKIPKGNPVINGMQY
jgi:hypothetical protein